MITANNGILIVAMTMALGLHWNSNLLIAAAFAMAGISYIINVLDDLNITTGRNALFGLVFAIGAAIYAIAGLRMIGG